MGWPAEHATVSSCPSSQARGIQAERPAGPTGGIPTPTLGQLSWQETYSATYSEQTPDPPGPPGPPWLLLSRWVLATCSLSHSVSAISSPSSDTSHSWRGFGLVGPRVSRPSRAMPCCLPHVVSAVHCGACTGERELVSVILLAGGTLIPKIFSPPICTWGQ